MKKLILTIVSIYLFGLEGNLFAQNSTILPSSVQLPNVSVLGTCSNLQKGQLLYLTNNNQTYYCDGTGWQQLLITANVANTTPWLTTGNHLYNSNTANVGVGLNNPSLGKLEVSGVAGIGNTNALFGSGSLGVSIQQNWPTIGFNQYRDNTAGNGKYMANGYAAVQYFDAGSSGSMAIDMFTFGSANTLTNSGKRAITIQNNGNVSIAAGAAFTTLYVPKNGNYDGSAIFAGTNYSSHFNHSFNEDTYIRPGTTSGKLILNDLPTAKIQIGNGNGNVGINISPASYYNLDIGQYLTEGGIRLISPDWLNHNWEIRNEVYSNNPGSESSCFMFKNNGNIMGWFRPTDGGYSSNSDRRLKRNIEPIYTVLNKINSLKPMRYEMIDNNPSHQKSIGFIAQEMIAFFPEVVDVLPTKTDANHPENVENRMGINYSQLSVIAIKAIQEQQVIIEELRKEIDLLKHKIKD
jgi:hypothetical protein